MMMAVPGMVLLPKPIHEQSIGGSETAGLSMAYELANLGWDVSLFCNTPERAFHNGVSFTPVGDFIKYSVETPCDVAMVQRAPEFYAQRLASKLNILWNHDLAIIRQRDELHGRLWNIDKTIVLSKFMAEQYREVYGLQDDDLYLSRNGIDLATIQKVRAKKHKRNPKRLIYTARPERGLDNALRTIMPRILAQDPDVELCVAAYDNFPQHLEGFYQQIRQLAVPFGERIKWLGALTKEQLYEAYCTSQALIYPTPSETMKEFREISCITAMEAMACGLPMVTSTAGALPETLPTNAGFLVDGEPWEEDFQLKFVDRVLKLLRNDKVWARKRAAGMKHADKLDWSGVAKEWDRDLRAMIEERNEDPLRLAHHFYRHSEIEGAKKLFEVEAQHPSMKTPTAARLWQKICRKYAWFNSEEGVVHHYRETVGPYYNQHLGDQPFEGFARMFKQSNEQRFHWTEQVMQQNGVKTMLDYGCGHGWCDVYLHNRTGAFILGVDAEPGAVEWQNRFASAYAKDPASCRALCHTHLDLDLTDHEPFDMVLISEVLEHVWNPKEVVEHLTRWVKPGGIVAVTVPFGPWELEMYHKLEFRGHIREFSMHDIRDMFGKQDDFRAAYVYEKHCPISGEALGWICFTYQKSNKPVGDIDWERKLRWQRPRQNVTAFMMAGGATACETLHWSLRSFYEQVDDVLVADCGLDDEAKRIFEIYDVRVVPSKNPREVGFERGRNDGLKAVDTDFGLWIDADEHLVNPAGLSKYLRQSRYNGFSIRQHHFTCDANFTPDMPVRCLRTMTKEGKKPRFYGLIHEHPEMGLNKGMGDICVLADVHIAHVGYVIENVRRQRFVRNLPLLERDEKKYPKRKLQKYLIMRDLCQLNRYELERNGGMITPAIQERAERVKTLYHQHFHAKHFEMNLDPLDYYSEALRMLGEGFDVSFDVRVNREGKGDQLNGGKMVRFADAAEAQKEIGARLRTQFKPLEGRFF